MILLYGVKQFFCILVLNSLRVLIDFHINQDFHRLKLHNWHKVTGKLHDYTYSKTAVLVPIHVSLFWWDKSVL